MHRRLGKIISRKITSTYDLNARLFIDPANTLSFDLSIINVTQCRGRDIPPAFWEPDQSKTYKNISI